MSVCHVFGDHDYNNGKVVSGETLSLCCAKTWKELGGTGDSYWYYSALMTGKEPSQPWCYTPSKKEVKKPVYKVHIIHDDFYKPGNVPLGTPLMCCGEGYAEGMHYAQWSWALDNNNPGSGSEWCPKAYQILPLKTKGSQMGQSPSKFYVNESDWLAQKNSFTKTNNELASTSVPIQPLETKDSSFTCAACGWPREHKEMCYDHCSVCMQDVDACWCCENCLDYPCSCKHRPSWAGQSENCEYNCKPDDCGCCCTCSGECDWCNHDFFDGEEDSNTGSGYMEPPWKEDLPTFNYGAAEGIYDTVQEAWPNMRCMEMDPVEMACDFYLLSAMTSGALNTQHDCDQDRCRHEVAALLKLNPVWTYPFREAETVLNEHVENCDRSFVDYIDMACGGELRHHAKLRNKFLSSDRSSAWVAWKTLRELLGVKALWDAGAIFRDFNSSGYGGPLWAGAAELLARRLERKIPVSSFVDQTFSLVHNGGVFLNKQQWACRHSQPLEALKSRVLPAQAEDDFAYLFRFASPHVRQLWRDCWISTNRARIRAGLYPTPIPGSQKTPMVMVCKRCHTVVKYGHLSWRCQSDPKVLMIDENDEMMFNYFTEKKVNWSIDLKTLYLYEGQKYRVADAHNPGWSTDSETCNEAFLDKVRFIDEGLAFTVSSEDNAIFHITECNMSGETSFRVLLSEIGVKVVFVPKGVVPCDMEEEVSA